ncbi:acetyltransferase (GNAT) domain-containing protein [Ditylenchus destructor]|uniref:Acetyltransferase (GNAT) domain-containing protein n=1 Tax=Ditylenchus destructor TaxID=166010 RepID=A0AAD4QYU8_9BILA|nr:acetyltransferase (GNAT) domain-containing protein [Ditylenchus destructor]
MDLKNWTPRRLPEAKILEGRFVRLEPLDKRMHGEELFEASTVPDAEERFRYLPDYHPRSRQEFDEWLHKAVKSQDPLYFAVIDKASGKVAGRQTFMSIVPEFGVIEIGHVYWGPLISRKPAATEAQFLFMSYAFDELGYRRYEWKCNNENKKSKRAAQRFGFTPEGVFRQHRVFKGQNRDSAYFSVLDSEWPRLKAAYEKWLSPENFDSNGTQIRKLEEFRE